MVAKQRRKSIKIDLRVPLNVPAASSSSSSRGERGMGARSISARSMGSSNASLSATELVFDPLEKDAADKVVDNNGASASTLDSVGFLRPTRQGRRASLNAENSSKSLIEHFEHLLLERGYPLDYHNTLDTGYYSRPTPSQVASYGSFTIGLVKKGMAEELEEALSLGLSPNMCNKRGESLLHMACRRGYKHVVETFFQQGALLTVADDYGRTPLHDCCWAATPALELFEDLLRRDKKMLFLKDVRGSLPLAYVHKNDCLLWMRWLDENIDIFFPASKADSYVPSDLALLSPNSVMVPSRQGGLSLELMHMVSDGELSPSEASMLYKAARQQVEDATNASTPASNLPQKDAASSKDSDNTSNRKSPPEDEEAAEETSTNEDFSADSDSGEEDDDELLEDMMQLIGNRSANF